MNYDEMQAQKTNKDEAPIKTLINMVKEPKKEETITETIRDFERLKQKPQYVNSHADAFLFIAIAIAVIGFIAGIICGVSIPAVEFDYRSFDAESDFNVALMFSVWAGTAITALGFWAIHCILDALDNLLLEAKRVKSYIEFKIDKENQ